MSEPKTSKHVFTNTSEGPRVLNSLPPVILQAGQSTDGAVEINEAELKSMKDVGHFEIGAAAAKKAAVDHDEKPA